MASLTLYSCDGQKLKVDNLKGSDQITMSLQNQVGLVTCFADLHWFNQIQFVYHAHNVLGGRPELSPLSKAYTEYTFYDSPPPSLKVTFKMLILRHSYLPLTCRPPEVSVMGRPMPSDIFLNGQIVFSLTGCAYCNCPVAGCMTRT